MGSLELSYDVKDLDKLERLKSGVDHYHTQHKRCVCLLAVEGS